MAAATGSNKTKIVVTGAGGRTGKLAVEYLLSRPEAFDAVAVARAEGALKGFAAKGAATAAVDVTSEDAEEALAAAFAGADAVIVATSAVPKIQKRSLVRIALAKIFKRKGAAAPRPTFTWKGGNDKGAPIEVDWLGQKRQIDAAVKAGVKRVVIVSSMGVTQVKASSPPLFLFLFLLPFYPLPFFTHSHSHIYTKQKTKKRPSPKTSSTPSAREREEARSSSTSVRPKSTSSRWPSRAKSRPALSTPEDSSTSPGDSASSSWASTTTS